MGSPKAVADCALDRNTEATDKFRLGGIFKLAELGVLVHGTFGLGCPLYGRDDQDPVNEARAPRNAIEVGMSSAVNRFRAR